MDNPDAEPWEIAAGREIGAGLLITMVAVSAVLAVVPPKRLVVLTGLRLIVAGGFALAAMVAPGMLAKIAWFASSGFLLLAGLSVAAHVESAVLGPVVDRLIGRAGDA